MINSVDTPARQSFVVEMVEDRDDLPNAIALNSSMINASRIIGPSVGGILIATRGEGGCFGADGISYLAVTGPLLAMRRTRAVRAEVDTHMLEELRTGPALARVDWVKPSFSVHHTNRGSAPSHLAV